MVRRTPVKVKNRKTGKTSIVKVPAPLAEQWSKDGGLPTFAGSFKDALKYIERQINSKNGSIEDGYIVLKIG